MLYKFRWMVAAVVAMGLFALGIIFDLAPRWRVLIAAQQEEKKLNANIAALPATRAVYSAPINENKNYLLPAITRLAVLQGVVIGNISASANNQMHIAARSNYSNMLIFHAALLKQQVGLRNFVYQAAGNNEVRFVADITASQITIQANNQMLMSAHNPFCGQAGGMSSLQQLSSLRTRGSPSDFSLDLQNTNLSDTVRLLAKMLNRNVIVSPAVEGRVTLHLHHAEPASVFDLLLDSYGLEKLQRGNVWYVAPRDELIRRKQQEMKWQNLSSQTAELITETWQIHYARAEEMGRLIQQGKTSFLSTRGQVRVDARTNIICVQDVPERMAVIRKVIIKLDQPAQQVRIEARLATVDNDFERELGVDFAVQANAATTVVPGRYSVAVARLPDGSQLDVKLAALEMSGHAELISSPSLYTTNQQAAAIEAGEEVPYQEVSESGGTAVVFKKAVLGLKVTPQILPGGYVLLQLRVNQDRPGSRMVLGMPTISTRQILTSVLVKSGQTAVLGGIYENQDEKAVRRIPLLGSVPVIGELFTLRASRSAKRQLLIFVTPKIMTQPP
jgi:type IV pilus assembly protein PilQ